MLNTLPNAFNVCFVKIWLQNNHLNKWVENPISFPFFCKAIIRKFAIQKSSKSQQKTNQKMAFHQRKRETTTFKTTTNPNNTVTTIQTHCFISTLTFSKVIPHMHFFLFKLCGNNFLFPRISFHSGWNQCFLFFFFFWD